MGSGRSGALPGGPSFYTLYGPHGPATGICGGVIARGAQGQFPDRFCVKTRCRFATHVSRSHLGALKTVAYYVRENDSHAYTEVCLPAEAAALATKDLLESSNNVGGWKAIIRQLVDQLAAGELGPREEAARAAGLAEFASRVLQTPYATTPMRATHRRDAEDSDDESDINEGAGGAEPDALQRLEDSVGLLRGELGVCPVTASYLTVHGGVGQLGEGVLSLQHEVLALSKGLAQSALDLEGAREESRRSRAAVADLDREVHELRRMSPSSREFVALT